MQYESGFYNDPAAYGQAYGPADQAQTPYGQTPYGQTPYGQTPYGQTPYGQGDFRQAVPVPVEAKETQPLGGCEWLTTAVICGTILLLIGIALSIMTLTAGLGQAPSTTEPDLLPFIDSPPAGQVVVTISKSPKTPRLPVPTTTPAKPPVTVVIPKEAIDKQPMVCTMGDRITSTLQFPPDALCDFIFFDSLYKADRNLLTDPSTYSNSLNIFLDEHPEYRHTTLGVGFSYYNLHRVHDELAWMKPSLLEPLWIRGIFHAGIFDTAEMMKVVLTTLEMINRVFDIQRYRGNFSITALAVAPGKFDWIYAFAKYFKELRFTPYLIITVSHNWYGDNTVTECAVEPPTFHPSDILPDDIARKYNYGLRSAVTHLDLFYAMGADTRGLVSVTLKGRWTEPLFPDRFDFFTRCASDPKFESFGSYTEVCPGGGSGFGARLNYSEEHCAVITYIESIKRTFVYDDERSFADKLCKTKALFDDVAFGIAVYDIDYDDYENKCASINRYNRNSRLKAVKKVVESFRRHTSVFDENICRKYAAP